MFVGGCSKVFDTVGMSGTWTTISVIIYTIGVTCDKSADAQWHPYKAVFVNRFRSRTALLSYKPFEPREGEPRQRNKADEGPLGSAQ